VEYWIIRRREARHVYLASRPPFQRPLRPKGALRPELSAAIAQLLPDTHLSQVLDPFCGSGSLGLALLERGVRRLWLNDLSPGMPLLQQIASYGDRVIVRHADFDRIPDLPVRLDAVVTDPPWGAYAPLDVDIDDLYQRLSVFLGDVLRPKGIAIVLLAAGLRESAVLRSNTSLRWEDPLPTLVGGRKAEVWTAVHEGGAGVTIAAGSRARA
jgi:tRNA G10  N-methylase Trm11